MKTANPYFTSFENVQSHSSELLDSSIEFAAKNKVLPLFYEGGLKQGIQLPKKVELLMREYEQRRKAQLEAVKLLSNICRKHDIELMFFKTFVPFNYVHDDIDVLLRNRDDLNLLLDALKGKGYCLLKFGTPEVVVRKVSAGTIVDIDIHKWIAIGHLHLFKTENLWRNVTYHVVEDGYKVPILTERYEVVREAAYSLLKDFRISVPGFYIAIGALLNGHLDAVRRISEEENLVLHLELLLDAAYFFACKLFDFEARSQLRYERRNDITPLKLVSGEICRSGRLPYIFPFPIIALGYLSKISLEMRRNRNFGVLLQIAKQPSSKGMNILLNYLKELLVG